MLDAYSTRGTILSMLDGSRTNFLSIYWICGSNTLCSSARNFEEEIFAGTNFRELAFDHENRENFPLYGIQVNTLSPLLPQNGVQKVGWRMCILLKIPNISDFSQ